MSRCFCHDFKRETLNCDWLWFACIFIVLAALLSMLSGCYRNVSEKLATIDRMCEEDIDSAVAMLHALGNPDDL